MQEHKENTATAGTSDGTILKPFIIDGGRFVVEVDVTTEPGKMLFSFRGMIPTQGLHDAFQMAEDFLSKVISDSKSEGRL